MLECLARVYFLTFKVLDPYVFNILPRSLQNTAVFIILLAVFGWYLSAIILAGLQQISQPATVHWSPGMSNDAILSRKNA